MNSLSISVKHGKTRQSHTVTKLWIENHEVPVSSLGPELGSGAQGAVYQIGQQHALKIYFKADEFPEQKLYEMMTHKWNVQLSGVMTPLRLAYADIPQRTAIGFIMGIMNPALNFEPLKVLMDRGSQATFKVTNKEIALIFLNVGRMLEQIHANGMVITDFAPQNVFFSTKAYPVHYVTPHPIAWIDVDSWQYKKHEGNGYTLEYLAPPLFHLVPDLSKLVVSGLTLTTQKPAFSPEHNWYAFAAMLFQALMLVHPYDGQSENTGIINNVGERAARRITVLHPSVTYPVNGNPPDALNSALMAEFNAYFTHGQLKKFPLDVLERYCVSLTNCPTCNFAYPNEKGRCPNCEKTELNKQRNRLKKQATVVQTTNTIIFSKVTNNHLYTVALEKDGTVSNQITVRVTNLSNKQTVVKKLGTAASGMRFDVMDDYLVITQERIPQLKLWKINGKMSVQPPEPDSELTTDLFSHNQLIKPVFASTNVGLFWPLPTENEKLRLCYFDLRTHHVIDLCGIVANSLIFANEIKWDEIPTVVGCTVYSLTSLSFWMYHDGSKEPILVAPMESGEQLVDVAVYFSDTNIMIERQTRLKNVMYSRRILINYNRKVFKESMVKISTLPSAAMGRQVLHKDSLYYAGNGQIWRENLLTEKLTAVGPVNPNLTPASTLHMNNGKWYVVSDTQVFETTV